MSMLRRLNRMRLPVAIMDGAFEALDAHGVVSTSITFNDVLRNAVKIRCQNVCDYYWEDEKDKWYFRRDCPNVAPPWKLAWFDWHRPATINKTFGRTSGGDEGALLMATELEDRPISKVTGERERWAMIWTYFADAAYGLLVGQIYFTVSESGLVIPDRQTSDVTNQKGTYLVKLINQANIPDEAAAATCITGITIPMLTLTFANTSNTEVVEVPAERGRKRDPFHRKNEDREVVTWHVLEIGKTRRMLDSAESDEATPGVTGLRRRLHIARGHFKDFREGKGLFGKHCGLYWWDEQVRGVRERGQVKKDYEVRTC